MARTILTGDKWYYHPEHGSDVKWREDEKEHYANGWCDTPDDFPSEDDNEVPVFDDMSRKEIREYGRSQGVELAWKGKDAMLEDLVEYFEKTVFVNEKG